MGATNFSLAIKRSNTDEWYTPAEAVELIVPYLKRRGYKKKYFARLTRNRANLCAS